MKRPLRELVHDYLRQSGPSTVRTIAAGLSNGPLVVHARLSQLVREGFVVEGGLIGRQKLWRVSAKPLRVYRGRGLNKRTIRPSDQMRLEPSEAPFSRPVAVIQEAVVEPVEVVLPEPLVPETDFLPAETFHVPPAARVLDDRWKMLWRGERDWSTWRPL